MKTRVIHLIGGRFDGAEMLFFGTVPKAMSIEALDRMGSTARTFRREYVYNRKSMQVQKTHTEYTFECIGSRERVDDVAG